MSYRRTTDNSSYYSGHQSCPLLPLSCGSLSQVVFEYGHLKFVFEGGTFTFYNAVAYSNGSIELSRGEPGFGDALVSLIGQEASPEVPAGSSVLLNFSDGAVVSVSDSDSREHQSWNFDQYGRAAVGQSVWNEMAFSYRTIEEFLILAALPYSEAMEAFQGRSAQLRCFGVGFYFFITRIKSELQSDFGELLHTLACRVEGVCLDANTGSWEDNTEEARRLLELYFSEVLPIAD